MSNKNEKVFLLLMFEMFVFMALIVPMPFTWKRKLFTFISENPLIAKLQYSMKVSHLLPVFRLVASILFVQSTNCLKDNLYFHTHPFYRQCQSCLSRTIGITCRFQKQCYSRVNASISFFSRSFPSSIFPSTIHL